MKKPTKTTVYIPVSYYHPSDLVVKTDGLDFYHGNVKEEEGYFFTSLEIQDIFTIFARENNISQEKVKIFLNDNFK